MSAGERAEKDRYFAVSLLLMLLTNRIIFPLGHFLARGLPHRDLSLPFDARVPFLPWTVAVYIGVFVWWLYVYRLASHRERREADRFFCALLLGKAVSLLFFVLLPTTIERPALSGNSLWVFFVRLLYRSDTPDNLFPSVHCLLGWLCWLVLRGKRDVPFALRATGFLLAAAVCASTLTVRQHVLADVIGGIVLAEICWTLCALPALRGLYGRLADALLRLVFRGRKKPGPGADG